MPITPAPASSAEPAPWLLLLASGTLARRLPFLRGASTCPALLPVGIKSAAAHIVDFHADRVARVLVMVNPGEEDRVREELAARGDQIVVRGVQTASVIHTLRAALDCLQNELLPPGAPLPECIVNLASTVPACFPAPAEVQIAEDPEPSTRWSSIAPQNGGPALFVRKGADAGLPDGAAAWPFTGVMRLPGAVLRAAADAAQGNDLIEVVAQAQQRQPLRYTHTPWIDVGHDIHYPEARARLIASRSFNAIRVEPVLSVLHKSSRNVAKFQQEIAFIRMLPEDIAPFFARLLSPVQVKDGTASVAMEFYGYPTVAELALFWDLDASEWERFFAAMAQVLRRFRRHRYELGARATRRFYGDKLRERVDAWFAALPPETLLRLRAPGLSLNSEPLPDFEALWPQLQPRIEALYDPEHFCVMHGDFCFNNILYDPYSGAVRLIDARGSFGEDCVGIYGDQKYDLAKLAHSAIGRYDHFISNLFTLIDDGTAGYTLRFAERENQAVLERLTLRLIGQLGYAPADVMLLTGMLFLSMTPLHADDARRQLAMYLHGLALTQRALTMPKKASADGVAASTDIAQVAREAHQLEISHGRNAHLY
ncbi:MAG TPA: phosphotransferase, partial [Burkholderiaceae bacterium]|nr:phosphotransferase [Burkholderiaceae bacterium]